MGGKHQRDKHTRKQCSRKKYSTNLLASPREPRSCGKYGVTSSPAYRTRKHSSHSARCLPRTVQWLASSMAMGIIDGSRETQSARAAAAVGIDAGATALGVEDGGRGGAGGCCCCCCCCCWWSAVGGPASVVIVAGVGPSPDDWTQTCWCVRCAHLTAQQRSTIKK